VVRGVYRDTREREAVARSVTRAQRTYPHAQPSEGKVTTFGAARFRVDDLASNATPRKHIFDPAKPVTCHCISRCVRRSQLLEHEERRRAFSDGFFEMVRYFAADVLEFTRIGVATMASVLILMIRVNPRVRRMKRFNMDAQDRQDDAALRLPAATHARMRSLRASHRAGSCTRIGVATMALYQMGVATAAIRRTASAPSAEGARARAPSVTWPRSRRCVATR